MNRINQFKFAIPDENPSAFIDFAQLKFDLSKRHHQLKFYRLIVMSHISIDIESQNSQSQLELNSEPSSGVEMATPASQISSLYPPIPIASFVEKKPQRSPCNWRFWVGVTICLLLAGALGVFSWQFHVLNMQSDETLSHYIRTKEQILTVNTTQCGKSFAMGFLTDNQPQPPVAVTTRTLVFNCPINQCSCDTYADQWISKQTLETIFYIDTNPTDFSMTEPRPLFDEKNGYLVGIVLSALLLFLSLFMTAFVPKEY